MGSTPESKPEVPSKVRKNVYIRQEAAGVRVYCPSLNIDLTISKPCYNESAVRHSVQTLAMSRDHGEHVPLVFRKQHNSLPNKT